MSSFMVACVCQLAPRRQVPNGILISGGDGGHDLATMMPLGQRLRAFVARTGMSRRDVSRGSGVSYSVIQKLWHRPGSQTSEQNAFRLSAWLDSQEGAPESVLRQRMAQRVAALDDRVLPDLARFLCYLEQPAVAALPPPAPALAAPDPVSSADEPTAETDEEAEFVRRFWQLTPEMRATLLSLPGSGANGPDHHEPHGRDKAKR